MCNSQTLELPATAGACALLPARGTDDTLTVSDGKRILCQPMMIDHNQMFLGAFGPEQTKIVYTFAKIVADFQVLKIRSVCTSRSDGGAGSYIMLGDICGEADRLLAFGRAIQAKPWFEPRGKKVVPEAVIDLKIFAPARRQMLCGALGIISEEYGVNIESMAHRTFHKMFDDGFDLLRQINRDAGVARFGGDDDAGSLGGLGGDTGTNGNLGGVGGGGSGGGGRGTGGGTGGGGGTGDGETGGGETGGGGGAGGGTGIRTGLGEPRGETDETDFITVTHLRLELPYGTNLPRMKHDLELLCANWEFRWEERIGRGKYGRRTPPTMFGGMN